MRTDNVELNTFSGWVDPPADVLPALTGDLTCDVAVIGKATALRLAERGQDAAKFVRTRWCSRRTPTPASGTSLPSVS
jgi:hypothetical protein